jgi:hypothetical protein
MSVTFFPVTEFLAFGVFVILVYCMFAALQPVVVIANIFELDADTDEASADSSLRRSSTLERRSPFWRSTTSSAGGRGSNYNFYVDDDEEDDEDEEEKNEGAASRYKNRTVSAGVQLESIRRLSSSGGVVMVDEVASSPMTEQVDLAEGGGLTKPSAIAAPR